MKFQELRNKHEDELQAMLKELQTKLLHLRFDLAEKKLKDFSQVKKTKTEIARVLTALHARFNEK